MKNYFLNKKIISIFITLFIIFSLLMLGPVGAYFLNFTILDDDITQGEMLGLQITVEIKEGELLDIQKLTLILDGPQQISCEFFPNATLINSCPGIEIEQVETSDYQFGYGYDQGYLPGALKYNVSINSVSLLPGKYTSKYLVTTPGIELESSKKEIIVRSPKSVQICSVRATGGTTNIGENTYTKRNRLNLYVPSGKASLGRGSFTAQNSNRISYTYNVNSAQQIGPNKIKFYVSGEIREHSVTYKESAVITLDKAKSTISIDGQTLDVINMKVNLLDC